ncbi:hypothetical protein J2S74_002683 [Evansella vedderi]|uniref:Secreted protein n=1 Tax=Evansella vedderi TaxID=38282 RepID=A0ABT9ZVN0_9BACI|nr:hypothetical protein [Evansella vedderi]MDQ0255301.1 hypothetical protein [Evansella vedderi]
MKNRLTLFIIVLTVNSILFGCAASESSIVQEVGTPIENDLETESTELDQMIDRLLTTEGLVPLGEVPVPEDNPMTEEVLELG